MISIVKSFQQMLGALYNEHLTTEKVVAAFDRMDKNKDGFLNLDEFINGMRKDPIFVKVVTMGH